MAIPATTPPLSPPLSPPAAPAEASDGLAREARPLHRSPVALRAETCGAVLVERVVLLPLALESLLDVLGAVELAKTDCPPCLTTPAVDPFARASIAPRGAEELGEP